MASPRLLLFALLLLVAGGGVFWFLNQGPSAKDSGGILPSEESTALVPGTGSSPAELGGELPDTVAGGLDLGPGRTTIESNQRAKQKAAEALQLAPDAKEYTGAVIDNAGLPVIGARVEITRGSFEAQMEAQVEASVSFAAKDVTLKGTTGKDGTFKIPFKETFGLTVAFEITADGYQVGKGRRTIEGLHVSDLGTFVLQRGLIVTGRITDETGAPVKEATVYRLMEGKEREDPGRIAMAEMGILKRPGAVETDSDGRYQMPHEAPGDITLVVEHKMHLPATETLVVNDVLNPLLDWDFVLQTGGTIAGRLVDFPKGRKGVRVAARQVSGERLATENVSGSGFGTMMKAMLSPSGDFATDVSADGTFLLRGLPKEAGFELRAYEADNFIEQRFLSPMVKASSSDEGVLLNFDQGAQVTLKVTDKVTGEPIQKFKVKAAWPSETQRLFFTNSGKTRRDRHKGGEVTLYEVRPPNNPDTLTIRVQATGYLDGWTTGVLVGEGSRVDAGMLALEPAPTRNFLVLDSKTREPVYRARLSLQGSSDGFTLAQEELDEEVDLDREKALTHKRSAGRTNKKGRCELTLFRAASARLSVNSSDHCAYYEDDLPLEASDKEHVVLLERGSELEFFIVDQAELPVSAARVIAKDKKPFTAMQMEENGRKKRTRVPSGTYQFRAERTQGGDRRGRRRGNRRNAQPIDSEGEEHEWTTVVVKSGEVYEVPLQVGSLSQLSGIVRANGIPLRGARVAANWVSKDDPGEEMYEVIDAIGGDFGASTETDGEGRYFVRELNPGYHRLRVRHPDFAMSHQEIVFVSPEGSELDVQMPDTGVTGLITDASGAPIAAARVYPEYAPKDGEESANAGVFSAASLFQNQMHHVRTDSDGRYHLRGLVAGRKLGVLVRADGFVPKQSGYFTLANNQVRGSTDLRLVKAGRIEISIDSPEPPGGLLFAEATYEGDMTPKPRPAITFLKGGNGMLSGLQPGPWKVKVTQQMVGTRNGRNELEPQTASVSAGEATALAFPMEL